MKKTLSLILSACMITSCFTAVYAGEAGSSAENPILISSAAELTDFANAVNSGKSKEFYRLEGDINLSNVKWVGIGTEEHPFTGSFDGNGHIISNYSFSVSNKGRGGLFTYVGAGGSIKKLGVEDANLFLNSDGNWSSVNGGLAAVVSGGTVSECYAKNISLGNGGRSPEVSAMSKGSGLVGLLTNNGTVDSCYSVSITVDEAEVDYDSGIVGEVVSGSTIKNCYTDLYLARAKMSVNAQNSYYLVTPPWPWSYGDGNEHYIGQQISASELQKSASKLGDAFKDAGNVNNGYPILVWETGKLSLDGEGTEENPYKISSAADFVKVTYLGDTEGMCFELTDDIDFKGEYISHFLGKTSDTAFKGVFDGAGHEIRNYKIKLNGSAANGLFSYVGGEALIKNLGVNSVYMLLDADKWETAAGAIAGQISDNARVYGCYAKNIRMATNYKGGQFKYGGGLIGVADKNAEIDSCYAVKITIIEDINLDSGIVGGTINPNVVIKNSYSDYTISCYRNADAYSNITNSYYISSLPWPWECAYDKEDKGNWYGYVGTKITPDELKGKAEELGSAFKKSAYANNGYPIFTWENPVLSLSGDGTVDDPYTISSADELEMVSALTDTDGKFFKLTKDIDLGGAEWYANEIGTKSTPFCGDFDGAGHTIKNYKITIPTTKEDPLESHGLFGYIGSNAYIHDLGVEDVTFTIGIWQWNTTAGAMVGEMNDSSSVMNCFAKNVKFLRESGADNGENNGHYHTAGGLVGVIDGDGCEVRRCYSLNIDNGIRKLTGSDGTTSNYATIMYNAGLVGRGANFAWVADCYSTQPMMQSKPGNPVNDCYQAYNHTNYYPDYPNWGAWQTEVNHLSFNWNSYFAPISETGLDYPVLKREANEGKYINLIPAGSMTVSDPNMAFGTANSRVMAASSVRASAFLSLPKGDTIKRTVKTEKGKCYKVTLNGYAPSYTRTNISCYLGDKNFADYVKTSYFGGAWWEEKTAYITADTTGDVLFTLSADQNLYIDDLEVFEVDEVLEKSGIDFNLQLAYQKLDVLPCDLYVVDKVYDGVDISYTSKNGYLDENGDRTDKIPTGLGTVSETFTASAPIGDRYPIEKSIDINILENAPYEIVNVGLTDKDGKTVYDINKADKIGTVKVKKNSAADASRLVCALYKGNALVGISSSEAESGGEFALNMSISGGDKVKLFVMDMSGITPLAFSKQSYDAPEDVVTIHTIGDSLCATYTDNSGLIGWGQVAGDYFDSQKVVVDNTLARGGMTAEEFISKGRFDTLLSKLKKNDYVFIQLATNDCGYFSQKEFNELLSQLIYGAREKGAIPVFVTSPELKRGATDTPDGNGGYIASSYLGGFPDVMREMGPETDVPVIDVNNAFLTLMRKVGYSGIDSLGYYVSDNVHFTNAGANFIAKTVADGVKALELPIADYVQDK